MEVIRDRGTKQKPVRLEVGGLLVATGRSYGEAVNWETHRQDTPVSECASLAHELRSFPFSTRRHSRSWLARLDVASVRSKSSLAAKPKSKGCCWLEKRRAKNDQYPLAVAMPDSLQQGSFDLDFR